MAAAPKLPIVQTIEQVMKVQEAYYTLGL